MRCALFPARQVGTDIQDNKCSWLVVQALERANEEQLAVLKANYAIDEEEKVTGSLFCGACLVPRWDGHGQIP